MFDTFVRFQARHRPHAPAIVRPDGATSFRDLDRLTDRVGRALAREGAADTKLAAVRLSDAMSTWLVLLALSRLGVGTVSFVGDEEAQALADARVDLLIVDEAGDRLALPGTPRIVASGAWFAACLDATVEPLPPLRLDPDAIGRVTLSSGTTGRRKAIGRSWSGVAAAVAQRQVADAVFQPSAHAAPRRTVALMGVDTVVFFHVAALWSLGGALVLANRDYLAQAGGLASLSPTLFLASPAQLREFVTSLPRDFEPLAGLVVSTGGSHTPEPLRELVRRRLAPVLWNRYASSEAGLVAMAEFRQLGRDAGAAGWLLPGVEVQVVDENGVVLPPDAQGALRIRSPTVVSGYLHDEEAGAAQFRDGWFYPGDVGSLSVDGLLRVSGRVSDLMNLGGVKVLPGALEEAARACAGVQDVAAFSVADELGLEKPWLAIVRGDGFDEAAMATALAPLGLPPVFLAWMQAIPRNERGKIDRDRLRSAALRR